MSRRIIGETIGPEFRQGDFYGGIDGGLSQMMQLVEGRTRGYFNAVSPPRMFSMGDLIKASQSAARGAASAPLAKFVMHGGTLCHELQKQRDS